MVLTPADEYYMQLALAEARQAEAEGEVPIGAIVVRNSAIVGKGHNQTERLRDVTAHAELIAMSAAAQATSSKYLGGCTLYVTLEPCPMCAAAMGWAQLGKLVYAAPDPRKGYSLYSPPLLHPRTHVSQGPLHEECIRLLKDFFARRR